jgi:hypothetical protein
MNMEQGLIYIRHGYINLGLYIVRVVLVYHWNQLAFQKYIDGKACIDGKDQNTDYNKLMLYLDSLNNHRATQVFYILFSINEYIEQVFDQCYTV